MPPAVGDGKGMFIPVQTVVPYPGGFFISMLALLAWREARGEGLDGMRCVMHVVRNRVLAWNKDWDQVMFDPKQFSSMTIPGDTQLTKWVDDDDKTFEQIFQHANYIYDGIEEDPTHGALWYANVKNVTSSWFTVNIIDKPDKHPLLIRHGNHDFYA